jgi:hypothetical protein
MNIFFITLGVVLLAMAGLAIGLILGRKGIQSSCGGDTLMRLCAICKFGGKRK